MNEEQKKDFLEAINSIPHWVKSEDDLKKFAKHLHYRLLQEKEVNRATWEYLTKNHPDLNFEALEQVFSQIHIKYDQAYKNS